MDYLTLAGIVVFLVIAALAFYTLVLHKGSADVQALEAALAQKAALDAVAIWTAAVAAEQNAAQVASAKAEASLAALTAFKAGNAIPSGS